MKTSFVIGAVLLSLFTVIHANTCELPDSANVTCIAEKVADQSSVIMDICGLKPFNFTAVDDVNSIVSSLFNVSTCTLQLVIIIIIVADTMQKCI